MTPLAVLAMLAGATAAGAPAAPTRALPLGSYFSLTCPFNRSAPDDPIVLPGQPMRSHDHAFIGNVSTNAFSTPATLAEHGSTCSQAADRSAYWAPTLYVNGVPKNPLDATIYYRRLTTAPVQPFPRGLEVVAGNSHAVTLQSSRVTVWECGVLKETFYGPLANSTTTGRTPAAMERPGAGPLLTANGLPTCPPPTNLELQVNFPDCSNGKATSGDHHSQLVYSIAGKCPSSHPVPVPALQIVLRYPPISGTNVFLASGGINSGHADFIDAWRPSALQAMLASCLNIRKVCQTGR